MRVLVTRPEPECSQWVRDLRARGLVAEAMPLLQVGPVRDASAVHRCWHGLAGFHAVMCVSGAAARHFFALRPSGAALPPDTRFWAPGPGTAGALLRLGVNPAQLDAPSGPDGQFDSEALWRVAGDRVRPGWQVLIVRGGGPAAEPDTEGGAGSGEGRDWLARALADAGAQAHFVMAYERGAPAWSPVQAAQARAAAGDGALWLFTSSQAVAHLHALLPGQSWARARALATHPRIVQAAREAGFGHVRESRPQLDAVVASIESGA